MNMLFPKPKKKPKRKRATKEERAYLRAVKHLGCVCCGCIPCDAHHPIMGRYSQSKSPHWYAIPLCDRHHQGRADIRGPAIHLHRIEWAEWFGTDFDYVADTQAKVKKNYGIDVPKEYRMEGS